MKHLYRLLIFVGLVLHVYVQCQMICRKDQYTVVNSDGSKSCLNCDTCHAGFGLDPPCGSQIPYQTKIDCVTCTDGKFSDKLDSAPCHSCQRCAEHEIVTAPCTNQSDRICNGTCEVGYFYSKKDSTHSCKKCSYCCLDEKDEEIPECANQGLEASKQHCHPRPDKDCNPYSSVISSTTQKTGTDASTNGSSTGVVIGGVFGGVGFIVVVAIACYVCLSRRKKTVEVSVEEGNGKASYTLPYASEGPQLATTSTQVQNVRFTEPEKSAPEETSGETAAATTAKQHGEKTQKLPDVKMGGKRSLSRQNSRDSQNSGDGETGFRKRSNSAIRLEKLTRKLSERDDSLLKEESAEEIHAYKCLGDIDFDTENRIGMLLTQTSTVVAGWKEIASKYGMNKLQIKSLENDPERGKRTLEYILSRNPNLTVYDFCKTLKEHNIRRLDIVDALQGHLSVSSSSDVYV